MSYQQWKDQDYAEDNKSMLVANEFDPIKKDKKEVFVGQQLVNVPYFPVNQQPSFLHGNPPPSSPPYRKKSQPDLTDFEFDESDVIFSSSSDSTDNDVIVSSPSPENVSTSPPVNRSYNSGIYAALSEDQPPFVKRRGVKSPSRAVTVAREVNKPVAARRSSAPVNVPVWPKSKQRKSFYLGANGFCDSLVLTAVAILRK
ncbi:senescence regulator S40 [Artemisia annua]|uniref:Senescence regulator S40 n=1 Tax=Artemisia annua TaxID=35608 RepID=A0A2U1Q0H5_ARTAN|nr:senescence regulator S40 [Artemisia annua]